MDEATPRRALSAEDILGTEDLEILEVFVPEWKGVVYIRVLPADEGLKLNERTQQLGKENLTEAMFLLLEACLCDSAGGRLFTTEEQIRRLHKRSQKVLLRLQQQALELQGWLGLLPKNA